MDGAKARDPHPAIWASAMPRWVGGHVGRRKTRGASPGGAAVGVDLGGSSKYSNENFEGWIRVSKKWITIDKHNNNKGHGLGLTYRLA